MADDKTKRGPPDSKLISLQEPYEVKYWTEKLGVSAPALRKAVAQVGHSAEKVRAHLKKK